MALKNSLLAEWPTRSFDTCLEVIRNEAAIERGRLLRRFVLGHARIRHGSGVGRCSGIFRLLDHCVLLF